MLFLSKLLPVFVYPLGLMMAAAVAALALSAAGRARAARFVLAAGIVILWTASTPAVSKWVTAALESQYPQATVADMPQREVAVVLGGAVGQPIRPAAGADLTDASDRVLHAARLFRAGKVDWILVSGGNLPWLPAPRPEATLIADLLAEWGVPAEAIVIEPDSRNTHENAVNSAAILAARGSGPAYLVTSAAHMPRALATFRRAGIDVAPATTDIRVGRPSLESALDLLPDAAALAQTTNAIKEMLGLVVYRLRGWA